MRSAKTAACEFSQELSLAALIGGNLFGRLAINPALAQITDKAEREGAESELAALVGINVAMVQSAHAPTAQTLNPHASALGGLDAKFPDLSPSVAPSRTTNGIVRCPVGTSDD